MAGDARQKSCAIDAAARSRSLRRSTNLYLVTGVVDGNDGLSEEETVGDGAGVRGLGKATRHGILAHQLGGAGEDGDTF